MISTSDNSSSEEEDSQELQRLKDAAVTLEPDGDLHASQAVSLNKAGANEETNDTKACRRSLRPSLRPKQTYSDDPCELKITPGFKTHVAKKLSDILDKELEFSESVVEKCNENKLSDSGIRLLSSSKDFLSTDPDVDISNPKKDSNWSPIWKPKSHTKPPNFTRETHPSSVSRKRSIANSNKGTNPTTEKNGTSSSDSSEDERFLEAAISFQDIKKKDELLSSFATPSVPILIIQKGKNRCGVKDDKKYDAKVVGIPVEKKKKKKKKKENCKETKENLLMEEEETKNQTKELTKDNKDKLCLGNNSIEYDEQIIHIKKKKKKKNKREKDSIVSDLF